MSDMVKIWSFEHDAWWAPHSRGYTSVEADAGLYQRKEAEDIIRNANQGGRINEKIVEMTSAPAGDKAEEKVLKLRISFLGMESNALRGIRELEALAQEHEDYDEFMNSAFAAQACISAYRDTILALCQGVVGVEEVIDFWFHGEDVHGIPLRSEVIKFTD